MVKANGPGALKSLKSLLRRRTTSATQFLFFECNNKLHPWLYTTFYQIKWVGLIQTKLYSGQFTEVVIYVSLSHT